MWSSGTAPVMGQPQARAVRPCERCEEARGKEVDEPRPEAAVKPPLSRDGGVRPSARTDALLGRGVPCSMEFLPVKREWADEPEDHNSSPSSRSRRRLHAEASQSPKITSATMPTRVATAIAERSLNEVAERQRHDEELKDLLFKQAVAANLAGKDKDDEWRLLLQQKTFQRRQKQAC
ncbi:abc transporter b family member mitochondrial [Hordeum vulgare]|nr:abc transporter b family member mitochondrial [Hordeum vulgare]